MKRYVVLEKAVGQTPLECAEAWRTTQSAEYADVPLAYAGRLDPMASGKLLVLISEECKQQTRYHGLDKEYVFEVLLGTSSDSGDVLGLVAPSTLPGHELSATDITAVCKKLTGEIALPYPKFSAKTVAGKPLHTWTMEGRLDEITIPVATTTVYKLALLDLRTEPIATIYHTALDKIASIPPVTDQRKALGNDFRRPDVRASWQSWLNTVATQECSIATFRCVASSGTYMRSLAETIGTELGTTGLAYSIHRTKMGTYQPLPLNLGVWLQQF